MTPGCPTPLAFCIPGDITLPTGGYKYDREVLARLAAHGIDACHVMLPGGYPDPSHEDLAQTERTLQAIVATTPLLIDGLALGAMPPAMVSALPNPLIALVHHPLGLEAGLARERAAFLLANERAVLAHAHMLIVPSRAMATWLVHNFAIAAHRIVVAEPGVDRAPRALGTGHPLRLLAVGAVSERKAYDLLVAALAPHAALDWKLTIVGSLERAPGSVNVLKAAIAQHDFAQRVHLAGACSDAELSAHYSAADVFVASSLLEGYGMALTEALVRGMPIVTSTGGAAADTVPASAALKVPPGDVAKLSEALHLVLSRPESRRRMADSAWSCAAQLPTWNGTAAAIAVAVKATAQGHIT